MAESLLQRRFLDEFGEIPVCAKIFECHQDEVYLVLYFLYP
jgi:hypothetical protein